MRRSSWITNTDRPREIAKSFGATVIDSPRSRPGEPYDHLRRLSADAAPNDRLLHLDADESLPVGLREYLPSLPVGDEVSVVRAPVLSYLGDELLIRGWPVYKPMVVRRDAVTFVRDVHDFLRIDGQRVDKLDDDVVHDLPVTHRLAVSHCIAESVSERLAE